MFSKRVGNERRIRYGASLKPTEAQISRLANERFDELRIVGESDLGAETLAPIERRIDAYVVNCGNAEHLAHEFVGPTSLLQLWDGRALPLPPSEHDGPERLPHAIVGRRLRSLASLQINLSLNPS